MRSQTLGVQVPFAGFVAIGMVVGILLGLTGIGAGSLLTPALILLGGLSPGRAVATSLAFAFVTKLYGSWSFYRRGFVRLEIVRNLLLGGLPGSLAGVGVIRYLSVQRPQVLDQFLLRAIGVVLILVSCLMILRLLPSGLRPRALDWHSPFTDRQNAVLIAVVGFLVGLSVSVTSIGSGAALVPALVVLCHLDSGSLTGTSLFAGTVLALVAGVFHDGSGGLDWRVMAGLLCGSLPGLAFGSWHHGRVSRVISEMIIAATLVVLGVSILV